MQMQALPDGSIRVTDGATVKILPPIFRADDTVIEPIASVQGGKNNQQVTLRRYAPVVTEEGAVLEEQIDHPNLSGLKWVRVVDNQVLLTKRARDHGVVFYRDMCLGRVPGVKKDPEKWGYWVAVKKMRGRGQAPERGALPMEKLYHHECIRRMEANENGLQRVDADSINALLREAGEAVVGDDEGLADAEAAMLKKAKRAEGEVSRG